MAMEVSPLDLLASAALCDPQSNTSATVCSISSNFLAGHDSNRDHEDSYYIKRNVAVMNMMPQTEKRNIENGVMGSIIYARETNDRTNSYLKSPALIAKDGIDFYLICSTECSTTFSASMDKLRVSNTVSELGVHLKENVTFYPQEDRLKENKHGLPIDVFEMKHGGNSDITGVSCIKDLTCINGVSSSCFTNDSVTNISNELPKFFVSQNNSSFLSANQLPEDDGDSFSVDQIDPVVSDVHTFNVFNSSQKCSGNMWLKGDKEISSLSTSPVLDNLHNKEVSSTLTSLSPISNGMESNEVSHTAKVKVTESLPGAMSSNCNEFSLMPLIKMSDASNCLPQEDTEDNRVYNVADLSCCLRGRPDSQSSKSSLYNVLTSTPHTSVNGYLLDVIHVDHSYAASTGSVGRVDSDDVSDSADEALSVDVIDHHSQQSSVGKVHCKMSDTLKSLQFLPPYQCCGVSPTLSVDSISNDSMHSENLTLPNGHYDDSVFLGSPVANKLHHNNSFVGHHRRSKGRLSKNNELDGLPNTDVSLPGSACGKFQIGTFGSVSNSYLNLDPSKSKTNCKFGLQKNALKHSVLSPNIRCKTSVLALQNPFGLTLGKSDTISQIQEDFDSLPIEEQLLSSSQDSDILSTMLTCQIWDHPVYHDHDYFCKEVSAVLGKPVSAISNKLGKRKYTRGMNCKEPVTEKFKKGKYLRKELLKRSKCFSFSGDFDSKKNPGKKAYFDFPVLKANPVGRPRKRFGKIPSKDLESGTKMKITGKYKDQYVYYYRKSSHNRRRKIDDKIFSDKLLPAPKPGDIVVPHLSDADCEAIRSGGRSVLNHKGGHCSSTNTGSHLESSDITTTCIVDTILSMENDNFVPSPVPASHESEDLSSKLTLEQMDLLIDCLKYDDEPSTSQGIDLFSTSETLTSMTPISNERNTGDINRFSSGLLQQKSVMDNTDLKRLSGGTFNNGHVLSRKSNGNFAPSQKRSATLVNGHSVERNLEYLTKTDFCSSTVATSTNAECVALVQPGLSDYHCFTEKDESETPWIVTVTVYYNDLPAIILNNTPFVRLIDIHRQILPAKDTGILKKRCQLMNIAVLNCTDMQRYFLVQYGRAQNSKSTIIISKDGASQLIAYYAQPQTRAFRGGEGTLSNATLPGSHVLNRSIRSGSTRGFPYTRKRGGFRRRGIANQSQISSPEVIDSPVLAQDIDPILPTILSTEHKNSTKQLRHKKIDFIGMLRGDDSTTQNTLLPNAGIYDCHVSTASSIPTLDDGMKHCEAKNHCEGWTVKEVQQEPLKSDYHQPAIKSHPSPGSCPEIAADRSSHINSVSCSNNNKPLGSTTTTSVTPPRSLKSKFGLFKVNVKSLVHSGQASSSRKNLFGKKLSNSGMDTQSPSNSSSCKVLRVSHDDLSSSDSSHDEITPPSADLDLDLFMDECSPCVKCNLCKCVLTVPSFLRHYVSCGVCSDGGVSMRQRVLVPLYKDNLSAVEQQLWDEFISTHSRFSRSYSDCTHSLLSYPSTYCTSDSSFTAALSGNDCYTSHSNHHYSKNIDVVHSLDSAVSVMCSTESGDIGAMPTISSCNGTQSIAPNSLITCNLSLQSIEPDMPPCSSPNLPLSAHTETKQNCSNDDVNCPDIPSMLTSVDDQKQFRFNRLKKYEANFSSLRTSLRKRKIKRLFDCENYDFSPNSRSSDKDCITQDVNMDMLDVDLLASNENTLKADTHIGSPLLHNLFDVQ